MLDTLRTAVTYSTGLYGGATVLYALTGATPPLARAGVAWGKMTAVLLLYLYVRRTITTN